MYVVLLLLIKELQAGKNSSIITSERGGGRMSTAKKLIIDNLSNIPDDIQDEFEVMENLYKLLRFRKSQRSVAENGGYTTDEVRKMFQKKHEERTIRGTDVIIHEVHNSAKLSRQTTTRTEYVK